MRTRTWVYNEVKHRATKKFVCRVCGKRGTQSRTFRQTVNPFNRNADGRAKTAAEILLELVSAGDKWQPDPVHAKCGGAA